MSDLETLCKQLIAAGISTGPADNYQELAEECVLNLIEQQRRLKFLEKEIAEFIQDTKRLFEAVNGGHNER